MKARIRFITVGILLAVFTAFSGSFMQWALGYGYTKDNPAGREKVAVHDEVAAAYQVEVTDAVVTAEAIRAASQNVRYEEGAPQELAEETLLLPASTEATPVVETQPRQLAASYTDESRKPVDASSVEYSFRMNGSEEDREILNKIVMAEAGDQDMKGQIMVANVILNRVRSSKFPNSVAGVVFAPGQFTPVSSGSYDRAVPSASVKEAVSRALEGEDYSQGALYFVMYNTSSSWFRNALTFVCRHGDHNFYK